MIQNLKQQVELLQGEVSQSRTSLERQLPPAGTPATHAVIPLNHRSPSQGRSALTSNNNNRTRQIEHDDDVSNPTRFLIANDSEQANRHRNANMAGQFSNDVAALRHRHAELEQNYGQQVQQLRRQLEDAHNLLLEADIIDPRSLSAARLVKRNPADARQRIAADERQRQHAVEVIELQKHVDRLVSQLQIKDQEISSLNKEKDAMVSDLVAAKDEGRSGLNEISMQKNQLDQLQKELRLEQEQRHVLEDKVNTLQRSNASSQQSQQPSEEAEGKIRQLTAQLSVAKCEADSAKMAEQKWRAEIEGIAQQNAQLARAAELSREDASRSDALFRETQGKLEDCEAQREFLQLTVDRMRVEETSVNARHHQLENILRAERENLKELEKRFNRALEDKDSLMRTLRQRESDQQRRDNEDTKVRAQAKYAIDTSDALKKENEELRHKVADLTRRLETTLDMQSTERQIQNAIQRMEQAKFDMQSILQKQIRVAQDVSGAIAAMPKKGVHQSPASRKAAANLSARAETMEGGRQQQQEEDSSLFINGNNTNTTASTSGNNTDEL